MHRNRYRLKFTPFTTVVFILLAAGSACAESLSPDAARRFVADKHFAFNCFDGSRGAGRINADGSVVGTIQFRGAGPARTVSLPAGTLRVKARQFVRRSRAWRSSRVSPSKRLPNAAFAARGWFCLLRLHAAHERRRHKLAPKFVRAAIARGGRVLAVAGEVTVWQTRAKRDGPSELTRRLDAEPDCPNADSSAELIGLDAGLTTIGNAPEEWRVRPCRPDRRGRIRFCEAEAPPPPRVQRGD